MPTNPFSVASKKATPFAWSTPWTPGVSLANLFALYPTLGDVTIVGATNIPSVLDGPIQVARYGNLTVNATLTTTNRCRGLVILADSLTMGAAGSISMTGRGAKGNASWVNQDVLIPPSLTLSGQNTSQAAFMSWLATNGFAIFDPTLFAVPRPGQGDVQANFTTWPGSGGVTLVSASGCGTNALAYGNPGGNVATAGIAGTAGTNAPGAGGFSGTNAVNVQMGGGKAYPWGGGPGAGGMTYTNYGSGAALHSYMDFCGQGGNTTGGGGGAGNPSGNNQTNSNGVGGDLLIFVRGNVTLATGHVISANGMPGEANGGGGSGGGYSGLFYAGTLTGTPNLTATGGPGGAASTCAAGGPGGVGGTRTATFAAMGY